MPTSVQTSTWLSTTPADQLAWASAVSAGIEAVGLVRVFGSPETMAEVWRFDDALQATHPVFIRITYAARVTANMPDMSVTIGRGFNNTTGAITGVLAPTRSGHNFTSTYGDTGHQGTAIEPIYVSSDGSSLCIVPRPGAWNPSIGFPAHVPTFVIDRSRDSAGNPTAAGGVIMVEGRGAIELTAPTSSAVLSAQMHAWTYTGDYTMGDVPAVAPSFVNSTGAIVPSTSLAVGDRAPVFPYVVAVPNHEPWQVLAAVAVMGGDAANGPFTANVLGQIRNYRSIPVTNSHNRWMSGTGPGYTGLCILWED